MVPFHVAAGPGVVINIAFFPGSGHEVPARPASRPTYCTRDGRVTRTEAKLQGAELMLHKT